MFQRMDVSKMLEITGKKSVVMVIFIVFPKKKGFRNIRSSRSEVFLGKGVLKIYSEFSGENPCRNVISIKFQSNFSEITLRQGCSPVNLLHIFRSSFYKNTYRGVLLEH